MFGVLLSAVRSQPSIGLLSYEEVRFLGVLSSLRLLACPFLASGVLRFTSGARRTELFFCGLGYPFYSESVLAAWLLSVGFRFSLNPDSSQ